MAPTSTPLCWVLLLSAVALASVSGQPYTMTVQEERPANTLVGNMQSNPQFVGDLRESNRTNLNFMFFGQKNSFIRNFFIEASSGTIYTTSPLDRETICPEQADCYLDFDVAAYSESSFKIFKVRVEIEDVNDNWPEFPEPEITMSVPESAAIDYSVPISGASDADTGENNGVQSYEILPADGPFGVKVVQNLDGTPELGIVVRRKLDREVTSSYVVQIRAEDGGNPPKTGSVKVVILISDVNDHSPVFSQKLYNITVEETISEQTVIVQVQAEDKDTGINGEIRYRFSSRTLSKYSDQYSINTTTGEIVVVGRVDYEKAAGKTTRLVVEAVDQGVQPKTSQALVMVNLVDVNDNPPVVKYNFLPVGDQALVPEHAAVNDFVAHVSATDLDSGENAVVDCRISANTFTIKRLYDNEFQVSLNAKLDREVTSKYNVSVICEDRGQPSFTVTSFFIVSVQDENDNDPIFNLSSYVVSVKESTRVGEGILQVRAKDKDVGLNGRITYRLSGSNSSFFRIDPSTGMLYVNRLVDYESTTELTFVVQAYDSGSPRRQNNVTVVVMVLDVNDEPPEFTKEAYRFRVTEERPAGAVAGQVTAHDPDQGRGGQLQYFIQETPESMGMFVVNADLGVITTTREIDRETTPTIHFFVLAVDRGEKPITSTVGVTVDIDDINDNSPLVHIPFVVNGSYPVYTNHPADSPFMKVIAKDPDHGENGTLSYSIDGGDPKSLFAMDRANGDIFLRLNQSKQAIISSRQKISLLISVKDLGSPQRVTSKRVNVSVVPINASRPAPGVGSDVPSNYIIVIAVICATTFLSVVIVIVIFVIRRRNLRDDTDCSMDSHDKLPKTSKVDDFSDRTKHSGKVNHSNDKTKKGVNFVIESGGGSLTDESSTDPIIKPAPVKPVPHDVIRSQRPLGTPNSLNLLWVDAKHETSRAPNDDLSFNILSPTDMPASARVWLHDSRAEGPYDGLKRPDDEASNVSGETVTSDSGRGGSEEDAYSRQRYGLDDQEFCKGPVSELREDSEYVDMQRSPLSYLAALRQSQSMGGSLPDHYHNILHSPSQSLDSGVTSCPEDHVPEQRGYTRMSLAEDDRVTSLPPPIPPRYRRLPPSSSRAQRLPVCKSFDPATTINVAKICRNRQRDVIGSDCVTYDDDDSATTTSGSYTIDDLSDCESHGFETANV